MIDLDPDSVEVNDAIESQTSRFRAESHPFDIEDDSQDYYNRMIRPDLH